MNLQLRLERLENKHRPVPGGMPVIIILPDPDEPGHAAVLADIARRQAHGERVVVVGPEDDELAALVDEMEAL